MCECCCEKKLPVVPVVNCGGLDMSTFKPSTPGSAGIDLRYCGEDYVLKPMEIRVFDCGFKAALPKGCVGFICPRSGLASKHGITVLNAPGVDDSDYRGKVGVILINLSVEDFVVHNNDRIAQLVIVNYVMPDFVEVETLDETERKGGFGHTGVN